MVGSALSSAQFFRAERSSYDVSLVLCFVDFVVVYGLVRKAPSLSSPVDIASLGLAISRRAELLRRRADVMGGSG